MAGTFVGAQTKGPQLLLLLRLGVEGEGEGGTRRSPNLPQRRRTRNLRRKMVAMSTCSVVTLLRKEKKKESWMKVNISRSVSSES